MKVSRFLLYLHFNKIYNKIEMLLFTEALGVTQEFFTIGIVLAANISSYVLTQPHTIMCD